MANHTVYPYGTGGSLPSSIGIINDTVTGGVDKALSAEQGKVIGSKLDETFTDVTQDGVFFVDAQFRVGAKITSAGLSAINILTFENL